MFSDTYSANRINGKGIFADVSHTAVVNHLPANLKHKYLTAVEQTLDGMASIRDNPAYCQFIGTSLGINLEKGFANLINAPLVIDTRLEQNYNDASAKAIPFPELGLYAMELRVNDYVLQTHSKEGLRTIIGHETGGHALHTASTGSASDFMSGMKSERPPAGQPPHKHYWHKEFIADALSVAGNLENNVGKTLAESRHPQAWLNNAYQKGVFGQETAGLFADFCMARDELLINENYNQDKNKLPLINRFFKMACSVAHPAPLVRAVKSENFAASAKNFLDTHSI